MENALRANPPDLREQYEHQLKGLQEAYGERCWSCAREKMQSLLGGGEMIETIRQGLQATASQPRSPSCAVGSVYCGARVSSPNDRHQPVEFRRLPDSETPLKKSRLTESRIVAV